MNARTTDFIVASLPTLAFDRPAPMSWAAFCELVGEERATPSAAWIDLETQLKNAVAVARKGEKYQRAVAGCSLFWRARVTACFQEMNPLTRETLLDRVWWDAAGELIDVTNPLGAGALAAYAVRLKIALKRDRISSAEGNAAFDRLTAETKLEKFDL